MIVRSKDEDEENAGLQREIQIWNTLLEIRKTKKREGNRRISERTYSLNKN